MGDVREYKEVIYDEDDFESVIRVHGEYFLIKENKYDIQLKNPISELYGILQDKVSSMKPRKRGRNERTKNLADKVQRRGEKRNQRKRDGGRLRQMRNAINEFSLKDEILEGGANVRKFLNPIENVYNDSPYSMISRNNLVDCKKTIKKITDGYTKLKYKHFCKMVKGVKYFIENCNSYMIDGTEIMDIIVDRSLTNMNFDNVGLIPRLDVYDVGRARFKSSIPMKITADQYDQVTSKMDQLFTVTQSTRKKGDIEYETYLSKLFDKKYKPLETFLDEWIEDDDIEYQLVYRWNMESLVKPFRYWYVEKRKNKARKGIENNFGFILHRFFTKPKVKIGNGWMFADDFDEILTKMKDSENSVFKEYTSDEDDDDEDDDEDDDDDY